MIEELQPYERQKIIEYLSLENEEYYKRVKMNPNSAYFLSKYIKYYREYGDAIIGPRGITTWLAENFSNIRWQVGTKQGKVKWPKFNGELRDYQRGDDEAISDSSQGLVELPTGYGKSVIAIKVAQKIKQKTLIIVPTRLLKGQFEETINKFTPNAPVEVHTIQGIMSKIKKKNTEWLKDFGCVIYDEAHKAPSEKSRTIWRHIPAHWRYGFTATPERSNGQTQGIYFLFGDTILKKDIERATPSVKQVLYPKKSLALDYHEIINNMVKDDDRNQTIADLVKLNEGRKILILTKRISHYETLKHLLPKRRKVWKIESKLSKKNRDLLMEKLKDPNNYDVILGTYSLLGTGVDIPSLDTLILAGDLKSHILAKQAIGRIERLFDGKPNPIVYDIIDTGNPILKAQAKYRDKLYRSHKWKVEKSTVSPEVKDKDGWQLIMDSF